MIDTTHIGAFVPGRGYCFFVSTSDLVAFRAYIAKANAHDREYYSLNSSEELVEGGAHYFLGLHRSKEEMDQFLTAWTLRID